MFSTAISQSQGAGRDLGSPGMSTWDFPSVLYSQIQPQIPVQTGFGITWNDGVGLSQSPPQPHPAQISGICDHLE